MAPKLHLLSTSQCNTVRVVATTLDVNRVDEVGELGSFIGRLLWFDHNSGQTGRTCLWMLVGSTWFALESLFELARKVYFVHEGQY